MVRAREKIELQRREIRYRQDRPAPDLRERVVILVDDGLATGATMRAAAAALRKQGVAKIVVAVPVGAPETCREIELEVDETICAVMPAFFPWRRPVLRRFFADDRRGSAGAAGKH